MPIPITEAQSLVLRALRDYGPLSCTGVGDHMPRRHAVRKRQCYARPAGAALHRLQGLGLVHTAYLGDDRAMGWRISRAGANALVTHEEGVADGS